MGKVGLLRLNNLQACCSVILLAGLLIGCARSAPSLPDIPNDTAKPTAAVTTTGNVVPVDCEWLDHQLEILDQEEEMLNAEIKGDRGKNQVAAYLGAFLLLPYLAMEGHVEVKQRLDAIQAERDDLYETTKQHKCSSSIR